MDYLINLIIFSLIYVLLAGGFNISFGLGRLLNLSHVAGYAIGAYTTALLSTDYQFGFFSCLILSGIFSMLFSLIIGAISLRLSDDYFAIGSLSFSFVISALLINWKSLTRGVLGIPGIPRPDIFTFSISDNLNFLIVLSIAVFLSLFFLNSVFKGPLGRSLKAQGEYSHALEALGVSSFKIRMYSFIISSFFAGISGCFFALYLSYIDPSSFSLSEMVFVLTIVIIGQPGSLLGSSLASFFLVFLPESLRFIELDPGILGPMRQLIYAVILFSTVYTRKASLFPIKRTV